MKRRIIITARYEGEASKIFAEALRFGELQEAMQGLAVYDGLPDTAVQEGDTYTVDVTVWKAFKTKDYTMHVARLDADACVLESQEHGGVVRSWNHRLSVAQDNEFAVWTDDITLDAGLMSFAMARFGVYMYSRRHRYRKALSITTKIERSAALATG